MEQRSNQAPKSETSQPWLEHQKGHAFVESLSVALSNIRESKNTHYYLQCGSSVQPIRNEWNGKVLQRTSVSALPPALSLLKQSEVSKSGTQVCMGWVRKNWKKAP
jgi:hypothetical protein